MSSSKDCLNPTNSVTYPSSTPESAPSSYIQIQNELTPARSPGSYKVRFSERANQFRGSSESVDDNTSLHVEQNSQRTKDATSVKQQQPSVVTTLLPTKKNLVYNASASSNGIIPGNISLVVRFILCNTEQIGKNLAFINPFIFTVTQDIY